MNRLRRELENIATADPTTWNPEMRGQFREWAQNRARHAADLGRSRWDADMREWIEGSK